MIEVPCHKITFANKLQLTRYYHCDNITSTKSACFFVLIFFLNPFRKTPQIPNLKIKSMVLLFHCFICFLLCGGILCLPLSKGKLLSNKKNRSNRNLVYWCTSDDIDEIDDNDDNWWLINDSDDNDDNNDNDNVNVNDDNGGSGGFKMQDVNHLLEEE